MSACLFSLTTPPAEQQVHPAARPRPTILGCQRGRPHFPCHLSILCCVQCTGRYCSESTTGIRSKRHNLAAGGRGQKHSLFAHQCLFSPVFSLNSRPPFSYLHTTTILIKHEYSPHYKLLVGGSDCPTQQHAHEETPKTNTHPPIPRSKRDRQ